MFGGLYRDTIWKRFTININGFRDENGTYFSIERSQTSDYNVIPQQHYICTSCDLFSWQNLISQQSLVKDTLMTFYLSDKHMLFKKIIMTYIITYACNNLLLLKWLITWRYLQQFLLIAYSHFSNSNHEK